MKENETNDGKRSGRTLTRMLTDQESAEGAFNVLHRMGYSNNAINLILSNELRKKHVSGDTEETETGTKTAEGAGKRSVIGGTVRAIVGLIAAIGTRLANIIS
jgi:hypothetical protein